MKPIISSCLFLLGVFSLSKFIFDPANLYYDIWWLDIPMHVLGGFGVAMLASAVLLYRGCHVDVKSVAAAYILVAVAWELYEYIHDVMVVREWGGWTDTLADFFNGLAGAMISYLLIRK